MKTRDSGMPEEELWTGFFSPEETLAALGLETACGDVVDFGCGYGTFTLPAARRVNGTVHALDIEEDMVRTTSQKAAEAGLSNVRAEVRDFVARGSGLPDACAGFALLFNILHCEDPGSLLREAFRVLAPGGRLAILHWNHDFATPRGPSMDIRPRPEQCRDWALRAGFHLTHPEKINLPPYHYGWSFVRPPTSI